MGSHTRVIAIPDIPASSGTPVTLAYLLENAAAVPITAREAKQIEEIEITAHDAAFVFSAHATHASNLKTQTAYVPYYRSPITYKHCKETYIRASADAAISGAKAEIGMDRKHTSQEALQG